jgi:hypothetical protein
VVEARFVVRAAPAPGPTLDITWEVRSAQPDSVPGNNTVITSVRVEPAPIVITPTVTPTSPAPYPYP